MDHIPGPWKATNGIVKAISHGKWFTICRIDKPRFTPEGIEANATFIVQACNNYESLVAALRRIANGEVSTVTEAELARATLEQAGESTKPWLYPAKTEGRG